MSEQTPDTEALIAFTAWLENLRADVSQTVNGIYLRGARVVPVGTAQNAMTRPTSAAGALMGFGLREVTGTDPAPLLLRDGGPDGDVVVPITLASGEDAHAWFGPGGINLTEGLYVDVLAGEVDGAVYLRGGD